MMQYVLIASLVCVLGAAVWIWMKRKGQQSPQMRKAQDMASLESQLMGEQRRDAA